MSEMQQRMTATEKSQRLALEYVEAERLELTQKLHENCEKMKSLTKERNELSELQESFELERRQLKEYVREMEAIVSNTVAFSLSVKCFFRNLVNWKEGGSVERIV